MPRFEYSAFDSHGTEAHGEIDATDRTEAVARIRERGLFPTSVTEVRNRALPPPRRERRAVDGLHRWNLAINLGKRVKSKVLTAFTRQMATLIEAGMPLLRGLRLLGEQEEHTVLKHAIRGIAEAIEGGSTLSEARGAYPKIFTRLYVNMVRAGEVAGALETVLRRLAEFQEKAQKIKTKVLGAMVYPGIVLSVSTLIVMFLMIFVVPRFQEIFNEMLGDRPLPSLTLLLLSISQVVRHHALATLAGLAIFLAAAKLATKSAKGRYLLDAIRLRLPLLGPLVRKVGISRFTRTLGTLVSSGVPILQALLITRDTAGNLLLANAVQRVHDAVKEGEPIAEPLKASQIFPPVVVGMIGIGEETGALPEMLMRIADNYDDEVDTAVAALTAMIEPLMIVALAVIVGTIVIGLFLPILSLLDFSQA